MILKIRIQKLFNISDEIIDLGSLTQWTTKDTKMNANYPVTQIEVPVDGYGPPPIPFLSFVQSITLDLRITKFKIE